MKYCLKKTRTKVYHRYSEIYQGPKCGVNSKNMTVTEDKFDLMLNRPGDLRACYDCFPTHYDSR